MKVSVILLSIIIGYAMFLFTVPVYAADPFNEVCNLGTGDSSVCQTKNTTSNPLFGSEGVLTKVIQFLAILAGVAAVFMMMVGGFKYVTSTGDPAKTSSAKNTILFAVIGLIVVAMAQAIVSFVLKKL